ncbi:unnamed protein product [Mucor hiemalis]
MPDIHNSVANINSITLQDKLTEFDILLPDLPFESRNGLYEHDSILDASGSMSTSQDITLNDTQSGFGFGNWERGVGGQDGIEVGRRDNEAGFADNAFDMDAIADPLKDMNLNDNNGMGMDAVDFDFDLNDNIDYGDDDFGNANFDLPLNDAEPSLDNLMDVGIVEDENMIFNVEEAVAEPPVRRRKRLVVDENTEIPQEDLHRYMNNSSSIVTKDANASGVSKSKTSIDLLKPCGGELGADLDSLFTRMNNKRRAPEILSEAQKQARFDDPFGAPTPAAAGATAAENPFHFEDEGDYGDDAGGFDESAFDNWDNVNIGTGVDDYLMTQNTQAFNNNTRQTLEAIKSKLSIQPTVKFGELASVSTKKADAAKLFYDVLLLSTKNKIKVKQDRAFGEIQISAPTLVY